MQLIIMKNRAKYIIKELGNDCKIIDESSELVTIEITSINQTTLISIFHAGINSGYASGVEAIEKQLNKTIGFFNY